MSQIHYFQRYSSRENVVTNNTLHLLMRVYEHSPQRLRALFTQMFEQEIELGVSFQQQTRGAGSVPDGRITQAPWTIAIETKVTAGVNFEQLRRHLRDLPSGHKSLLLLLTVETIPDADLTAIRAEAAQRGVLFQARTFGQICELLQDNVEAYETHLVAVVEDYISYCDDEKLRRVVSEVLRIVPCGATAELNQRYGVYYHPQWRGY